MKVQKNKTRIYIRTGEILNNLDEFLKKNRILIFVFLALYYCIVHYKEIVVLDGFPDAVFPLNCVYITRSLVPNMLAGGEKPLITPSNMFFIYPPGIYLLSLWLGTVKNMFLFSFIIQSLVPLLVFNISQKFTSVTISLLFSLVSISLFTNCVWWSPDWIVQPLILVCLFILIRTMENKKNYQIDLGIVGFLTGLSIVLKHNIGGAAILLATAFLFFKSLKEVKFHDLYARISLFFFTVAFLTFGCIFGRKLLFLDELIFFVLPYVFFWAFFLYLAILKVLILDIKQFFRDIGCFYFFSLILPVCVFLWMSSLFGYKEYFFSLFGMGLKFQHIWEHGIVGFIKIYTKLNSDTNALKRLIFNYRILLDTLLVFIPFLINCGAIIFLIKHRTDTILRMKKHLSLLSISIVGIFMLFPLEGYHNLFSRIFIFFVALIYILKESRAVLRLSVSWLLLISFSPILLMPVYGSLKMPLIKKNFRTSYLEEINNVVGLPIEENLVQAWENQVLTIKRSIGKNQYYVIDSTGATLASVLAFVDNHYPQYYLEMRHGILEKKVVEGILYSLSRLSFVIVNTYDYERYINKKINDPYFLKILSYVDRNFKVFDLYSASNNKITSSLSQVSNFLVMKKRKGAK